MPRIANVNVPNDKRIEIALTYIYGIGRSLAGDILENLKIDKDIRAKDLSQDEIQKLRNYIEKNHRVEGDLKREKLMNIKRLKEINAYRGSRHVKNLPARGQRTKTNSRTVRGNVRRTMGSGKAKAAAKT